MQNTYAVLMGDLIESSKYARPGHLHQIFNRLITGANRQFKSWVASPLTITLGDEFQGLALALEKAFALGHYLRLHLLLKGARTRMAIGTVTLETPLNPKRAWNMMGEGLAEAREKLADKKEFNCYRFSFPNGRQLELLLDGVGRSLTRVESDWTDTQLEYVSEILSQPDKTRVQIATSLNISENSLYKVLRSAHFGFYQQQIKTVETVLRMEDEKQGTG